MTDQQNLRSEASGNVSQTTSDTWRKEIHARVSGYRTRRGRRTEGAYSMRFPFPYFEPDVSSSATISSVASPNREQFIGANVVSAAEPPAVVTTSSDICDLAELSSPESEVSFGNPEVLPTAAPAVPELRLDLSTLPSALPRPRVQRKVIAFPRQMPATPETVYRLADPVLPEQPRILDVPEELEAVPSTPFLDGLQFGTNTQPAVAARADNVELPRHAAGRAHRFLAGLLDCVVVAAATAVFAAATHQMLPHLLFTKPMLLATTGLPVLLWAAYHYLLLVYGGATAGMRLAKVRLSTFKGKSPCQRERRRRVMALYFSTASFVMGLLWAFVDVDGLCWHDRISQTYLTDTK